MVALHRYDDPDSGMLAFLRERRAEADAALPKSAALAAFGHLTIAVVALTLSAFLRAGAPTDRIVLLPPIYDPAPPPLGDVNPIPDPTSVRIPPVVDQSGLILPVDDAVITDQPPVENVVQPTGQGAGPVGGDTSGPVSGAGGGIVAETIPPPDTYTYREVEPEVTHKVIPAYPDIAKLAAMDGNVIVRVFVGTDGRVKRAEIEKGNDLFNDAALEAVRQWRFTPALNNNQPVGVWVRIPIHFQING